MEDQMFRLSTALIFPPFRTPPPLYSVIVIYLIYLIYTT